MLTLLTIQTDGKQFTLTIFLSCGPNFQLDVEAALFMILSILLW